MQPRISCRMGSIDRRTSSDGVVNTVGKGERGDSSDRPRAWWKGKKKTHRCVRAVFLYRHCTATLLRVNPAAHWRKLLRRNTHSTTRALHKRGPNKIKYYRYCQVYPKSKITFPNSRGRDPVTAVLGRLGRASGYSAPSVARVFFF